jgi:hypothetical protein
VGALEAGPVEASAGYLILEVLRCANVQGPNGTVADDTLASLGTYAYAPRGLAAANESLSFFRFQMYVSDPGLLAALRARGIDALPATADAPGSSSADEVSESLRVEGQGTYQVDGLLVAPHDAPLHHVVAYANATDGIARWDYAMAVASPRESACTPGPALAPPPPVPPAPYVCSGAVLQSPASSWAASLAGQRSSVELVVASGVDLDYGTLAVLPYR